MAVSISLSIAQNSQSVANNTSNVTVKVTAHWTGGSHNYTGQCTGSITIDGTKHSFTGITFNSGQTTSGSQVIMTKSVNVSHDSDGTKTLNCSASFVTGVSSGTVTCSGSKELTTIPRKSTLSANNGTLGTEQTLAVSRKSSSFTHTITYKCGDASGTIVTKSSDLTPKWTPPLSLAQQNTTGTSVSITFTITTYSGSTSIGSNTETISCSIPASVKPTISLAVSDPMGYVDDWGVYVQSKSKLKIVVSSSGSQGSTIKSYKVTADGKTYTVATTTTGVISGSGSLKIDATVTDSRGRTATTSVTVPVEAYSPPRITSMSVRRCNADGTENAQGEYGKVIFSSVIPEVGAQSEVVYTLEYKKDVASTYTTIPVGYDDNFAVTNGFCVFPAEKASSYNVRLTADCTIEQATKTATLSSIKKVWSLLKKQGEIVGMAIGKIAEVANVFDVGLTTRIREHLNVGNKTGHLDGKTGVFISKEGYIQVQRGSSEGYHPYISFFHDDADYHAGMIRQNCNTKNMDFTGAEGYTFDSDTYIGSTTSWEDGKPGVRMSKSGGLQIQRASGSSPYIDFFFNGSADFDARIIHVLDDKRMKFKGASAYEFEAGIIGNTYMSLGLDTYNEERGINTLFKDGSLHWIMFRGTDGLTSNFGWAGNASNATITKIRGQTCQYQNASGTTTLSDERLKKDFTDLEKWEKFFNNLEPCAFKMKAGNSGRFHVGFKAQQVEQALIDAGLTTEDFAGFIRMKYTPDDDNPDGNAVYEKAGIKAGDDELGLIYSEFVALNTFKIQKLQNEVAILRQEIEELKGMLKKE